MVGVAGGGVTVDLDADFGCGAAFLARPRAGRAACAISGSAAGLGPEPEGDGPGLAAGPEDFGGLGGIGGFVGIGAGAERVTDWGAVGGLVVVADVGDVAELVGWADGVVALPTGVADDGVPPFEVPGADSVGATVAADPDVSGSSPAESFSADPRRFLDVSRPKNDGFSSAGGDEVSAVS